MNYRRTFRWLVGAVALVTLILGSVLISHNSTVVKFSRKMGLSEPTAADYHIKYEWQSIYWMRNAEPVEIEPHRALMASMRTGSVPAEIGEFMVTGHRVTAGHGAVLAMRKYVNTPNSKFSDPGAGRYEYLTIYLPDGLPMEGETLVFGETAPGAPFAIWSEGEPLVGIFGRSCFGYAVKGTIEIVESRWEHIDAARKDAGEFEKEELKGGESVFKTDDVVANISLEFEPYREDSFDGLTPCGYFPFSPNKIKSWAGVIDQLWFSGMEIGDLEPWQGSATGPLTGREFMPEIGRAHV